MVRGRAPTLVDVARLAGVSVATASKALNGRAHLIGITDVRGDGQRVDAPLCGEIARRLLGGIEEYVQDGSQDGGDPNVRAAFEKTMSGSPDAANGAAYTPLEMFVTGTPVASRTTFSI